jgi:hypothetical protein
LSSRSPNADVRLADRPNADEFQNIALVYEIEKPDQLARIGKARRITDPAVPPQSLRMPITPCKGVEIARGSTPLRLARIGSFETHDGFGRIALEGI